MPSVIALLTCMSCDGHTAHVTCTLVDRAFASDDVCFPNAGRVTSPVLILLSLSPPPFSPSSPFLSSLPSLSVCVCVCICVCVLLCCALCCAVLCCAVHHASCFGVWCVVCGVWWVVGGVWCVVVCGVWCVWCCVNIACVAAGSTCQWPEPPGRTHSSHRIPADSAHTGAAGEKQQGIFIQYEKQNA